jgi:hypothetical protein
MAATIYFGRVGFYIDVLGMALLVLSMGLVVAFVISAFRQRTRTASYLSIALVASMAATASLTLVARPEVWVQIANHYEFADPARKSTIAIDLKRHWLDHDNIRVSSWIVLAERWGVCHGYWPQRECRVASKSGVPMGDAREHLANIAKGA